jgi:hypothetical protein
MNKERRGGGPGPALLLLIPAALIIARGARRRRAMWASGQGPWGFEGPGHRHGARFGPGEGPAEGRAFRLPPKLEWMLSEWHTRAHQSAQAGETTAV